MEARLIPLLSDNYGHLLVDRSRHAAVVIDPSEAPPVLAILAEEGLRLEAVWNTHHHFDHVGGNEELRAKTGCAVVASARDRGKVPGQTAEVRDGDELSFGGSRVEVIENPGHTLGAISFYMESQRRLFTGDTLFTAGCGRLFEGTPAQMWASLLRLRALPAETLVCCGHEYTEANLAFARHLEPENPAVAARQAQVQAQRERGEPTVPATLGLERETNPFLRADDPALLLALERLDGSRPEPGVAAFARLRARKDTF